MRVALAFFFHETNTFAPARADMEAFRKDGSFGGIKRGPDLIRNVDVNMPYAGFAKEALGYGWELAPLTGAGAVPSAQVTREAYETIAGMIIDDLRAALPVDAVYLDLHGAMVAEDFDDGEGELLKRVRAVVGPAMPVVVSLDFHANVSREMVELSDALFIYRTYPHVDLALTGQRAAKHLKAMVDGMPRQAKAMREIDFLIPAAGQATATEPLKSLYAKAASLEGVTIGNARISTIAMAPCFPLADVAMCRPTITVYADNQGAADAAADELAEQFRKAEDRFVQELWEPRAAVREAMRRVQGGGKGPVLLADTQDNPGGGGNGDTVGLLRALLDECAEGSVLMHIWDPETADAAHAAGVGAVLRMGLGAKTGWAGEVPVEADWIVEQINDGDTRGTGPMAKGWHFRMGRSALLSCNGVRVGVISRKGQCLDQAQVRIFGVEPSEVTVLALKSTVHYRADFEPLSRAVMVVKSPGPVFADHRDLTFRKLKPGVRVMPGS
ncbi:MAG: M81 family metallopeptidase [Micropepsaceae bacterium]